MKLRRIDFRCFLMCIAVVFACTACVNPNIASTIALTKTEGELEIIDRRGKDVLPKEDLHLFDGYMMATHTLSYAWMDLDRERLVKMDQESQIEVQKERKKLEIVVQSGSLFFHIAKPLEEDESLDIRTSSMMVGIRGTCGWVEVVNDEGIMRVYLLEGKVECSTADRQEMVQAGEMAVLTEDGEVSVSPFTAQDIPDFVMEEIQEDEDLREAVEELDLPEEDEVNPLEPDGQNPSEVEEQNSSEVIDALERYRDVLNNRYAYSFSYSEPAKIYQAALIKMEREDRVPTLLLLSEHTEGVEYVYVFRYDPVSGIVHQANDALPQGVAFAGGFRGEVGLMADGDGIQLSHWSSGTGEGTIHRVTMDGSECHYTTELEGSIIGIELPAELVAAPIEWHDIGSLEWMDNWKFDNADPYSETQDFPETTASETREESAGSPDNHDFGTPGNRPYT